MKKTKWIIGLVSLVMIFSVIATTEHCGICKNKFPTPWHQPSCNFFTNEHSCEHKFYCYWKHIDCEPEEPPIEPPVIPPVTEPVKQIVIEQQDSPKSKGDSGIPFIKCKTMTLQLRHNVNYYGYTIKPYSAFWITYSSEGYSLSQYKNYPLPENQFEITELRNYGKGSIVKIKVNC